MSRGTDHDTDQGIEQERGALEGWNELGASWREGGSSSSSSPSSFEGVDLAAVRARSRAFARRVWLRNLRETAAGVLVAAAGVAIATHAPTTLGMLGGVAMVLGAVGVSLVIALGARNRRAPEPSAPTREVLAHERGELERQARLLERVWLWYLAPLLPSVALIYAEALIRALGHAGPARTVGVAMSLGMFAVSLGFFFLVGRLNARAARELRARMGKLPES